MQLARSLPATLSFTWRPLLVLAIAAWLLVNAWLVWSVRYGWMGDWGIFASGLEHPHNIFPPLTLALWPLVVVPIGFGAFLLLHIAAVLLLRDWWMIVVTLTSAPFWHDAIHGNVNVFPVVAGVLALRGSRGWALAYIALLLLFPKPLFVPLAIYLFWKRPDIRMPAIVMTLVVVAATLGSGYALAWVERTLAVTADYPYRPWDLGPTRFLGAAWLAIGVPLAAWLTWRGRVGWAGLAITPYLVPVYFLALLFEARRDRVA